MKPTKIFFLPLLLASLATNAANRYVDSTATAGGTGLSWATAYTTMQSAIAAATLPGDTIFVAKGTYQTTAGSPFAPADGVKVLGGFPSGGSVLSARNWVTNVTRLQANTRTVVSYDASIGSGSLLDGFTVFGADVNSFGGIYILSGSPQFANLIIRDNFGFSSKGGGMTFEGTSVISTLTNVTFISNQSGAGGAIANTSSTGSIITIKNSSFINNTATGASGKGGGIYFAGGSTSRLILDSVLFDGNTAAGNNEGGGAIYTILGGTARFIGNQLVFNNNRATGTAATTGGAVMSVSGAMTITNSVFYNNSVTSNTGNGGAFSAAGSSAGIANTKDSLINVTFANNAVSPSTAGGSPNGGALYNYTNGLAPASGNMYLANSVFYNNTVGSAATSNDIGYGTTNNAMYMINNYLQSAVPTGRTNFFASGNIPSKSATDPFTNLASPKGTDGKWMTIDDGLHLAIGSLAIDSGSTAAATAFSEPADIAGFDRSTGTPVGRVDMGAYEGPAGVATPIHLISFTGELSEGFGHFHWASGVETGFDHFELEKSTDGQHFTIVGIVAANGNNGQYDFDLKQLESIALYRLKMIDFDGRFQVSNVLRLTQILQGTSLIVYPNPAQDKIVVQTEIENNFHLYNTAGQLLQNQRLVKGINNIDLSALPKGIYYYRTNENSGAFVKQ